MGTWLIKYRFEFFCLLLASRPPFLLHQQSSLPDGQHKRGIQTVHLVAALKRSENVQSLNDNQPVVREQDRPPESCSDPLNVPLLCVGGDREAGNAVFCSLVKTYWHLLLSLWLRTWVRLSFKTQLELETFLSKAFLINMIIFHRTPSKRSFFLFYLWDNFK